MISVARGTGLPVEWDQPYGPSGGPLTWRPILPHPSQPASSKDAQALVTCPNGHECVLSGSLHTVADDGTVSPSDVCPYPGCTFHDFIKLEDWQP